MAHETRLEIEPDEVESLINAERWLVLATIGTDGNPNAEIVPGQAQDGFLKLTVALGSASHVNLQHDDRVCVIVENAQREFYRMRSASIHGRATFVDTESGSVDGIYSVPLDDIVSFDFSRIQVKH